MPKSLVDVGGINLISHTIDMLHKNNIEDISVIIGYKYEMLEDVLKNKGVKIYNNRNFSETNSIYSLFLAKDELADEDVILANADVFWETELLNKIVKDNKEIVMLSDMSRVDNGDYFFNTDEIGRITDYGKTLTRENRTCEYVGVAKIQKSFISNFKQRLCEMIENNEVNKWWEEVLYSFVGDKDIFSLDVENIFWAEVDTITDYERIKEYVKVKNERIAQQVTSLK